MKVIVEQADILDALLALVDEDAAAAKEILRRLVKESEPFTGTAPVAAAGERQEQIGRMVAVERTDVAMSPLMARCEQLRDQHGPVYVIEPKGAVEIGQKVQHGTPPRTVEVLERADLAGEGGKIVPGRWYAKLLDA